MIAVYRETFANLQRSLVCCLVSHACMYFPSLNIQVIRKHQQALGKRKRVYLQEPQVVLYVLDWKLRMMYSAKSTANGRRSVECLRRRGALLALAERVLLDRGVQVDRSLVDVDLREHDQHAVELVQVQHEVRHVLELPVSTLQVERPDALEQRVIETR
jgi:hypothetical protein